MVELSNMPYQANFNTSVYDCLRLSYIEDKMIFSYHQVIENPLRLMNWIYIIDEYYLLLFPHMLDKSANTDEEDSEKKSVGGIDYGKIEGRIYFEDKIRELLKRGSEVQKKNERAASRQQWNKVKIDGQLIADCREVVQKLKIMKKYLGFEVSTSQKRSIDSEWRAQYGRPKG
jgi:hypothetical protein